MSFMVSAASEAGPVTLTQIWGEKVQSKILQSSDLPWDPSVRLLEVAGLLGARTSYNPASRLLQLYFQSYQVKVQDGNPFLIAESLTDQTQKTVFQLSAVAVPGSGDVWIDVVTLKNLLRLVVEGTVDPNSGPATISISYRMVDLDRIVIEEKSNGTLLRFPFYKPLKDFENRKDESGKNYLTLVNVRADIAALNATKPVGLVEFIDAKPLKSGALQLIVKVNPALVSTVDFEYSEANRELVMNIRKAASGSTGGLTPIATPVPVKSDPHMKDKWALDVIVLDAGHGGKDPGTIGKKGTREKDVTLGVVLKLGKKIEKEFSDIKVVYTRDEDVFIPLDKRGKIANQAKGKLFISVHCNANKKKDINGVESYFLGLNKSDEALEVSKRENAVILDEDNYEEKYKDFNEENLILLTMAQSAFLEQSEKIAINVSKYVSDHADRDNRGVKQAGFMVLWTPSMPSILIETGFLSNLDEEKFLSSEKGQQKVADAIFKAIVQYKNDYEKSLGKL
ncbi:MAG: N-acetylmuramoyl-L-alanine amidase [Bacteroidetes bacterium]|nr:N-acetylmuramoyl-L-alanine amidase [Bacteroidota bacterium]